MTSKTRSGYNVPTRRFHQQTTPGTTKKFNGRRPYLKGYAFETKVRKTLEKYGYKVFRQRGSAFPDLICLSTQDQARTSVEEDLGQAVIIECKVRKYLTPEERSGLASFNRHAEVYVCYPEPCPNNLRKTLLVFARPSEKAADQIVVLRLESA